MFLRGKRPQKVWSRSGGLVLTKKTTTGSAFFPHTSKATKHRYKTRNIHGKTEKTRTISICWAFWSTILTKDNTAAAAERGSFVVCSDTGRSIRTATTFRKSNDFLVGGGLFLLLQATEFQINADILTPFSVTTVQCVTVVLVKTKIC